MHTEFWRENSKERNHAGKRCVGGKTRLKWVYRGYIRRRELDLYGSLVVESPCKQPDKIWVSKIREIFWLSKELSDIPKGICCLELVTCVATHNVSPVFCSLCSMLSTCTVGGGHKTADWMQNKLSISVHLYTKEASNLFEHWKKELVVWSQFGWRNFRKILIFVPKTNLKTSGAKYPVP